MQAVNTGEVSNQKQKRSRVGAQGQYGSAAEALYARNPNFDKNQISSLFSNKEAQV